MANTILGMAQNYNSNSLQQNAAIQSSTKLIKEAIDALDITSVNMIADFGSSHGTNSIRVMKIILEYLRKKGKIVIVPI